MQISGNSSSSYQKPDPGTQRAVLTRIIDLGTQASAQYKPKHKVMLAWELEQKMEDGRPFLATARFTASLHEKAVLTALGEVSNALIARQKLVQARSAQERAVAALNEAVSVSTERYTAGKSSYYEILEAQQQLFPTEINLARTRLNQYVALIQLYRALGGGWHPTP